ncbi:MAG: DUF5683 domain-containing protein [Flavobacteriaceae bacterium]|nr:DUF5683 domain-containing protein [Flavobacteriaceae bacterium]
MSKVFGVLIFLLFCFANIFAQQKKDTLPSTRLKVKNYTPNDDYFVNPLAPAKAAFYSTILPGLGQAYNKKYWKIPLIYGALGSSLYFYKINNDNYNRVFDALKLELQGKPHEFESLDIDALERAINRFKKDRDLALFISVGLYILNILEANVDAHLPDKKLNSNLSFTPNLFVSPINSINYGVALTFKF